MPHNHMEILAPAGDMDMVRAAVFSGADCVYVGVQGFNARSGAANFGGVALSEAVGFCHARECKVYAALNTLALPGEDESLQNAITEVANAGCDAVIVQDIGTAALVRQMAPTLPLHASTQMSVHSLAGVRQLAQMGFSRVILARELTHDEISHIAKHSPVELEVFVHGALCVCVSGQCLMSAFLGGRSANRGACAGPCRLPFAASCGSPSAQKSRPEQEKHALSLKDLSILDALPELASMGVVSAKIEGRLRGPEYCALAVDAARKALNGEKYDKQLLQDVFSRSGFTGEWYTGTNSASMFGARTSADTSSAKTALPKARELYRREAPRTAVKMQLVLIQENAELTVCCGAHTLRHSIPGPLPRAEQAVDATLCAALGKTGGTPFYASSIDVQTNGFFLPAAVVSDARRQLLAELLALREAPTPIPASPITSLPQVIAPKEAWPAIAAQRKAKQKTGKPLLRARFSHVAQMPQNAAEFCAELLVPLHEAQLVPPALRGKTILCLPRAMFGPEEQRATDAIDITKMQGFAGYYAQNMAHLWLCRGLPLYAGFGLNAANTASVGALAAQGCHNITLSPELSLAQMRTITQAINTETAPLADALCYGHLPLMLTRACPIKQAAKSCAECKTRGYLTDRKGVHFKVTCQNGAREIYNPVPLWMADRLAELPTHTATLWFTTETAKETSIVLGAFAAGEKASAGFTRGLYDKGLSTVK